MILVVDDSDVIRDIIRQSFEAAGHDVVLACDAYEALAMLDDGLHPRVILTDLIMPGMDGNGLIREIRKRDGKAPVIVFTGFADCLDRELLGGVTLVCKPIPMAKLVALVEQWSPPEHAKGEDGADRPKRNRSLDTQLFQQAVPDESPQSDRSAPQ